MKRFLILSCPYRKQNLDYVNYLLTALYFESWNIEDWEYEITEDDLAAYKWENSRSEENITKFVEKIDVSIWLAVKSTRESPLI